MQCVIVAIIGAWMAIAGTTNLGLTGTGVLTLGSIASFLTLTRNFINPISQISNQFNSIVTALAGASRIFAFMDEQPETDEGYVTLVNAKKDEHGNITECAERTGMKHYGFWMGDALAGFTPFWIGLVFYLSGLWKRGKENERV